ncbi:MAG: hypothetical protein HUU29_14385 [Planctomycetaceae bacterium]|nr:hypothetical protein [Planctomycetaceae bacterium]
MAVRHIKALTLTLLLAACSTGVKHDELSSSRSAAAGEEALMDDASALEQGAALKAALDKSVGYLLKNQNPDGSWGHHLPWRPNDIMIGGFNTFHAFGSASTALVCMGLLQVDDSTEVRDALARGFRSLIAAEDARRIDGRVFYNTWAHTYMVEAFAMGLQDARLAELHGQMRERCMRELDALLKIQCLNGGWGYYDFGQRMFPPSGDIATPFNTAAALVAMHAAREAGISVPQKVIDGAFEFLRTCRVLNGAYLYSYGHIGSPTGMANNIRGSIGRSQSGNCAFGTWKRLLEEKDIRQGLDDFFTHHHYIACGLHRQWPHEAFYATAPYYYLFGHHYAACNIALVDKDARPGYARRLGAIIAGIQEEDGSIWDYPLYGYTKAYGTGYGAGILARCLKALNEGK